MSTRSMGQTGTPDPVYDLISVAYHGCKGPRPTSSTHGTHRDRAIRSSPIFFNKTQQQCRQCANEAQRFLVSRLQRNSQDARE
jgi:hypothetical protein